MTIATYFYEARQPEIDVLKTENKHLSDNLEAIDLDTKALVDENDELKAEVEGKKRVIETMRGVEKILRDDLEKLFNENAALNAEVERLRKDRELYRQLKDRMDSIDAHTAMKETK